MDCLTEFSPTSVSSASCMDTVSISSSTRSGTGGLFGDEEDSGLLFDVSSGPVCGWGLGELSSVEANGASDVSSSPAVSWSELSS